MKYFDYAATCPMDEDALNIYVEATKKFFGNTNSLHHIGGTAATLLERCRAEIASLLQVEKRGIYFTSGGTESNLLAIESVVYERRKEGSHLITSLGEHSSIINLMQRLENEGFTVTYLPLTEHGIVDVDAFKRSITPHTIFATVQHGNSEIGTIQPIKELAKICQQNNIHFHTDCVQTFGKLDVSSVAKFCDSLSICAHKFYGPKGTGAVYVNPNIRLQMRLPNVTHERGFRAGTVDVPAIAAMTAAAQKAVQRRSEDFRHYQQLRQTFLCALTPIKEYITIFGSSHMSEQLPSIVGIAIKGLEGQWVMLECDRHGFAISTGSACQVGQQTPTPTMNALGIAGKQATEFIRISFGRETTNTDVENLATCLIKICQSAITMRT